MHASISCFVWSLLSRISEQIRCRDVIPNCYLACTGAYLVDLNVRRGLLGGKDLLKAFGVLAVDKLEHFQVH